MNEQQAIKQAIHQANTHNQVRYVILDPSSPECDGLPTHNCYVVATPEQEATYYQGAEVIQIIYPDAHYQPATLPGFDDVINLDGLPLFKGV